MVHLIHGFALGGLERVVLELATRTRRPGVSSTVVSFGPDGPMRASLARAGVPLVWLRDVGGLSARAAAGIRDAVQAARATVVHAHDLGPMLNAVLGARLGAGVPVVVTLHQSATPAARHRIAARGAAALVDAVVACAPGVARSARAWGLEPHRVIENGVELRPPATPGDRRAARAALRVGDHVLLIGYVGRLSREKGPDLLVDAYLRAFRDREDVQLVLVGDGPLRAELEARARGRGVRFAGARDDARALLPALDVYAQPSRAEGRSLSLLEAMAAGVPTVASRIPAVEEVHAHGETALLCTLGDVGEISAALERLVASGHDRRRLGAAARERAGRWDVRGMIDAYLELYRAATVRASTGEGAGGKVPARGHPSREGALPGLRHHQG